MNDIFDDCLYFKLNRLLRKMTYLADSAFSKHNIASSYAYLILLIAKKPNLGTVELSQNLNLSPSTVTRLVDKMILMGYLKRIKGGKRCEIKCTEDGEKLASELSETWQRFQSRMLSLVGNDAYKNISLELQSLENKIL